MKLTYHGHAAWEIETSGARLWIDPFLSGNPMADLSPDQVEADFVVLSHAHGDHLGDTEVIASRTGATVIAMNELAQYLAGRGLVTEALQLGGGQTFAFGRAKLVPALHSSSVDGRYMGTEAGILLRDTEGTVLYHAGDTGLFSDMALIGRAGLDAALLPIGDKYTMGPEDAAAAVEMLQPRLAIPMHYDTFEPIRQDPHAWKRMVESRCGVPVLVLKAGESCQLAAGKGAV
ncbi:MAG: metal-dependent hydrolase [Thermoleophilia bacterium]|nr:metal-dependent hydrolase [Thermoleophilia bacterium]